VAGVQRKSWCTLTIRLLGRTEIRRLAKELDFRPRKSLGQNFVHDANTVRRVVSTAGVGRSDVVLEVVNGIAFFTPLWWWLRAPRVTLVHHVHQDHYVAEMGRSGRLAA